MKTHELKTWPDFFDAVWDGRKTFEVRRNDRGFQAGDEVILREWNPPGHTDRTSIYGYTNREVRATIGYVLATFPAGPELGPYVVFSLVDTKQELGI